MPVAAERRGEFVPGLGPLLPVRLQWSPALLPAQAGPLARLPAVRRSCIGRGRQVRGLQRINAWSYPRGPGHERSTWPAAMFLSGAPPSSFAARRGEFDTRCPLWTATLRWGDTGQRPVTGEKVEFPTSALFAVYPDLSRLLCRRPAGRRSVRHEFLGEGPPSSADPGRVATASRRRSGIPFSLAGAPPASARKVEAANSRSGSRHCE